MGASISNTRGFTLVEISIVMIIIGLLIGGTFGGMKLIENMQVNKTVQDLKAIESAALTFKDTYGRLPGDIVSPAARLPNCTVAPCATGGDGDRRLDSSMSWSSTLSDTDERFTFWHQLQAANLIDLDYYNTTDMDFGEGQPSAPIGGGYRIMGYRNSLFYTENMNGHIIGIVGSPTNSSGTGWHTINCAFIKSIDSKMDNDWPTTGRITTFYCVTGNDYTNISAGWGNLASLSTPMYKLKF